MSSGTRAGGCRCRARRSRRSASVCGRTTRKSLGAICQSMTRGEREPGERGLPDERFGLGGDEVHGIIQGGSHRRGAGGALRPPPRLPRTGMPPAPSGPASALAVGSRAACVARVSGAVSMSGEAGVPAKVPAGTSHADVDRDAGSREGRRHGREGATAGSSWQESWR